MGTINLPRNMINCQIGKIRILTFTSSKLSSQLVVIVIEILTSGDLVWYRKFLKHEYFEG